jgi:hypothetical protein
MMTLTARAAKKLKIVASQPTKKAASTLKGKVSEPNVNSNSEAQNLPHLSSTIDFTKPISMILHNPPTQTVNISSSSSSDSSSSSSEETLSDSSHETISVLLKKGPKPKPQTKTPVVKEFVSDGNYVLDHLTSHISGDAFTTSNLNSPNHPINRFLSDPVHGNFDPEPEIPQNIPPPPKSHEYVFRASPMHFATPEQEIHNTITITEPDQHIPLQTTMPEQVTLENISEIPQENLNAESTLEPQTSQPEATQIPPTSEQCDAIPTVNLEHHIPLSPIAFETLDNDTPLSSYPSSPNSKQLNPIHGPTYKPLTLDEIGIPS